MKIKHISFLTFIVLMLVNCNTNPFTGKKTMAFVSNEKLIPMSFQEYNKVITENKVIKGTTEAETLKRVGNKIKVAAERWLDANGYQGYTKDYEWEFNLIDDDETVNAWAMPGGKVAFYTGILPIAENERGIATIMGHEVAHALANHGQQRMSASILQQVGAVAGSVALSDQDPEVQQGFMSAYGAGSQVLGMLPFSRKHETEADRIGLTLMAIAGYDPTDAYKLWERMANAGNGEQPPEFLSTHPSHETRISNLKNWASEAKETAKKFGVTSFK
ncbi:M48 family metallopeptidase [Psychroflexus sp. MBR-150]|jgi:predicted Zn-dependent protease